MRLVFSTFCMVQVLAVSTMPQALANETTKVTSSNRAFDHSHQAWTSLLQKHVKIKGLASAVDYKAIKVSPKELQEYLRILEAVSQAEFNRFSEDEKLAFLINAYNAFTVKLILDHYPVKSIKDIGSIFSSPWKKKFFRLLGEEKSLDDIEHDMIRKSFNEPRIHFAVVCASIGCPSLRNEAYQSGKIDAQLDEATRTFLSDKQRNCYHPDEKRLDVSPIFKWYGEDFVKKYGSLEDFLATRITANSESQKMIRGKKISIHFTDYDWSLNDEK